MKTINMILLAMTLLTVNTTTYENFFTNEENFYLECYQKTKSITEAKGDYLGYASNWENFPAKKYLDQITDEQGNSKELYGFILAIYSVTSIYKNKINPYHNACHAFMTMMISGELYKQIQEDSGDYEEEKMRAILYAGLFHDAGHPGYGNSVFENDERLNKNLLLQLVKFGVQIDPNDRYDILEDIHIIIAQQYCNHYLSKNICKYKNYLIEASIADTNMAKHFKLDINNKTFNNDITYLVHFADIAASASKNKELILLLAYAVLTEFFVESYKKPNFALCKWVKDDRNADPSEEIVKSQIGFIDFFLIGIEYRNVGILDFLPAFDNGSKQQVYDNFMYGEEISVDNEINIQEYFAVNLMWNKTKNAKINIKENFGEENLPFLNKIVDICSGNKERSMIEDYTNDQNFLRELLLI